MSKHVTLVSHDHSSSLAIVDSCTKDKHQRFRMIQVNLSKALPKTGTIEDTFTSLSQTWRNQGTDQSAHLTLTWIWTKMHCSTFTCGATTFTSTEPLQFCKWVDKSKWGKAGKGYKNNRPKLNWQTQESKAKQPIMTNSILTILKRNQGHFLSCVPGPIRPLPMRQLSTTALGWTSTWPNVFPAALFWVNILHPSKSEILHI